MIDFSLSNYRLADPADILEGIHGGNIHRDLQSDVAVGVDFWGDINVDAHVGVLKLSIH